MIDNNIESNKKQSPNTTDLFIRRENLNLSLVFISQSCMKVPNYVRKNATHCF